MNLKSTAAYFTHIEDRYKDGKLSPVSCDGRRVLEEIIQNCERLKVLRADIELKARAEGQAGDGAAFDEYLSVVDLQMRLVLLAGKFIGFQDGLNKVLVYAGSERQYFM